MADVTFKVLVSKEQAEQAWNDIQSKMTAAQGTAKGMTQTLNELKTKLGEAKVGSDAFKELAVRAKQAEDELKRMQSMAIQAASGQKQFVSGVDQASQAIGQFGWVMGDADMFLVNFRMGMMSIGNNIPMVAQAFMRLKDEVQQTGGSMKSALMGALTGSGGVMLGINALMFALNALPKLFGDAKASAESWDLESLAGETDDFAKAMVKLNKEIKSLSSSELDSYLERLSKKLTKLQTDVAEAADKFAGFAVLNSITGIDFGKLLSSDQKYEDFTKKMTATVKAIKEINDQKNTPGIIGDLEKKIKDLREQRSSETTVEGIKKLNAEIDKLQKQLDGLLGKSDSKADNKVKKLISAYVDELSKLKGLDFNFTNEIDDKTLKNQQEFIEKFKNNLERQGLKWDDKNREFAYYLSLQLKPASNEDKLMKEINIKGLADFNPWAGVSGLSGAYEDNAAALRKIAKEEAYLMNDIATSFGSTLASEGKKAFESIFGEANSLLEKFAMSIFDKFTGRIGNEISDMIFGAASGLGSTGSTTGILSTLLGFLGSSGAPTGGRTTINVMLDGETISEKVVTAQNVTRAIGKAQSMRLIN